MMTDWYQRSINALQLNGKGERTQEAYTRAVRMLSTSYCKPPDEITEPELEAYFLRRRNVDHWSPNTMRICSCGIRFFFVHVLQRNWHLFDILRAQSEARLPAILSCEEVRGILRSHGPSARALSNAWSGLRRTVRVGHAQGAQEGDRGDCRLPYRGRRLEPLRVRGLWAAALPGEHFMVTFTVPKPLRPFLRRHQTIGYGALFAASSGAIKTLAVDPSHIGGDVPGFFGVVHTWGRTLQYHPHIHDVVVGGALSSADGRWHPARPGFYLPVRALSRSVRGKFRDQIAKRGLLGDIPPEVWAVEWNVNCQAAGDGSEALQYLAPYVFKVAIAEHRILAVDAHHVHFRYQKPHSTRVRTMTLPIIEFLRRFLQHVLPRGFMKVRYYGFLSPSSSVPLEDVKARIEMASGFALTAPEAPSEPLVALRCRHCGGALRFSRLVLPGDALIGSLASLGQRADGSSTFSAVLAEP